MAKGSVIPHNMLGRTQWGQPGLSRRDMRNMNFVGPRSAQGVFTQSPRGQKTLERGSPGFYKYVKPSVPASSTLGIPYYDPNTVVPFVARFGEAPAPIGKLLISGVQISEKNQARITKVTAGLAAALWGAANLATANSYSEYMNFLSWFGGTELPFSVYVMIVANLLVVTIPCALALMETVRKNRSAENKSEVVKITDDEAFKLLMMSAGLGMVSIGFADSWWLISGISQLTQGAWAAAVVYELIAGDPAAEKDSRK